MSRFKKRVAKMRKEYLAKVAERERREAEEQAKAKLVELQARAQEAGIEGYENMNLEQLEQTLIELEQEGEPEENDEYKGLNVDDLRALAKEKGLTGYSSLTRDKLIEALEAVK